jgi:hypothetical protein
MNKKMKEKLEAAITACAAKAAEPNVTAKAALQYTQAAMNASEALVSLTRMDRDKG